MNVPLFDTLTRRLSLALLGAAGLAMQSGSFTAAGNKRNKINKKARKKCKQQIDPCTAVLESECGDDPDCLACCEFAGRCDFAGLVDCVNASQSED